jgi:hypothetical protein
MIPWKRAGVKPLWISPSRKLAIVSAFTADERPLTGGSTVLNTIGFTQVYSGYRCQVYDQCSMAEWASLARGLLSLKIKVVCGQVASGSSIAFTLQAASGGKLRAVVLGKDGYSAHWHSPWACITEEECAIVDDVVSTGDAMAWSINKAKEMGGTPSLLLAFSWSSGCPDHLRTNAAMIIRRK